MGKPMLVEGQWRTDISARSDAVQFEETGFRDWIRDDPDARFPPESDRYHLYVSYACPWAHGTLLVRLLCGLTDDVTVDVLDPYRADDGWQFTPTTDGCTPDSVNGHDYLREVYVAADPTYTGQVTVPVLFDRERGTVVNNESIEIMRMLNEAFQPNGTGVDLYPAGYREEVDRIVDDLYDAVNTGVYKAGFADNQSAYDDAVTDLFAALDRWDEVLADRRYLAGDRLTLADLRLFPTLLRFDQVYHTHFKCNERFIHQFDNLWPYLRDLYQLPGVAETVRMDHIKEHYYTTHTSVNPTSIVAAGPDLDFEAPHDRASLPGTPPRTLEGEPT